MLPPPLQALLRQTPAIYQKNPVFLISSNVSICFVTEPSPLKPPFRPNMRYSVELSTGSAILIICNLCWTGLFHDLLIIISDHRSRIHCRRLVNSRCQSFKLLSYMFLL
ncbi:hypothetical protein QL285_062080 [Trifolium repens]|nr:hypothetical protein QL285_062080 [Trifolium repens]